MRVFAALFLAACLLPLTAGPATAEEVLKPTKAFSKFRKDMRPYSGPEREAAGKKAAQEYLAAWEASGKTPTPTDNYVLAQFRQEAGEYKKALEGFHAVQSDQEVKEKTRDYAANAEALILLIPALRQELGKEAIDKALAGLCAYADKMPMPAGLSARSKLRTSIAMVYDMGGRMKDSQQMRMQLLKDDPGQLSSLARPIIASYLRGTHKLAEYDTVKKEAAAAVKFLKDMQQAAVNKAQATYDKSFAKLKSSDPGALDAEGNLKKTSTKGMSKDEKAVYTDQRKLATAQDLLADIDEYAKPIALLGTPAADWTAEHLFGEVETLASQKGKVVVLDFWATMYETCNFPLMRDLLKEYGEKGLSVIGVTVTGPVVYADRFAMDEDMKSKGDPGAQLYYAALRATERQPADGEYILDGEAYRSREKEAIQAFIEAHELKWPHVMIDKDEPAPKYAHQANGGPHLVILDKEGRIRFFRSGELPRADKEGNAALRTIIADLLAE